MSMGWLSDYNTAGIVAKSADKISFCITSNFVLYHE